MSAEQQEADEAGEHRQCAGGRADCCSLSVIRRMRRFRSGVRDRTHQQRCGRLPLPLTLKAYQSAQLLRKFGPLLACLAFPPARSVDKQGSSLAAVGSAAFKRP